MLRDFGRRGLRQAVGAAGRCSKGARYAGTTTYPVDKIKVVLLEGIHERAAEMFRDAGFQVRQEKASLSGQQLIDVAGDCHLLGIRSKTQLTDDFFATVGYHAHRLWGVGTFCIGTNQVDLGKAAEVGVPVFNAPFSNTRSVAEKTIAEVVALSRRLFERSTQLHAGRWVKSAAGAHEVRGMTLGIVGYGRIGAQVSMLAEAMGMRVLLYDMQAVLPLGNAVRVDSLSRLLAESDCLTLHVPDVESSRMLIGEAEVGVCGCVCVGGHVQLISRAFPQLRAMKKGAYLINNARGSVVDVDALAAAIKDGHLGGAVVDVFPSEPAANDAPFSSPLCGLQNVILTPHIGGSTEEAQFNIAEEVASKLISYMNSGATEGAVNVPSVALPRLHEDHARLLHFHHNLPGVANKLLGLISERGVNLSSQVLQTNTKHGACCGARRGVTRTRKSPHTRPARVQATRSSTFRWSSRTSWSRSWRRWRRQSRAGDCCEARGGGG